MQKIIFATHLLPFQIDPITNKLEKRKRHTSVYAVTSIRHLYIGLAEECYDDSRFAAVNCIPLSASKSTLYGHYEGYCKQELWPLLHYMNSNKNENSDNWKCYQIVNQMFADAIVQNYVPGDAIWINDYHLLMTPQMVRKQLPNALIAFFLHTPFPTSEIFRCLPQRCLILESMLNSDLVGFQTYSYSRHFISSASRLLNLEATPKGVDFNGKIIDVGVFPIGIDVERVQSIVKKVSIIEKTAKIRELYHGKLIIIGRDKLDHPRSVVHLLCAFERFLEDFPEWLSKVVLIQVTTPPQVKSKLVEKEISKHVQRINGRFGSLAFSPVHHYHHHLDEDEYFSLLQVANVGLITSLRDGMNSSCSEFVICQEHSHAPLILSEFTGTAGFLSSAMLVNPWDYQCVSRAINEALTMSKDEKRLKHQLLFDHVCRHTSQFWAKSFLSELEKKTSKKAAIDAKPLIPKLDSVLLCSLYNKSMRRLILLDYDGTLSPIAKTPNAAYPLPETIKAIKKLVSDPLNLVFIISGRDQACLDDWLGEINGLGLSAEHGCFIKQPNLDSWTNLSQETDSTWQPKALEIFNFYTERTSGSFVEMKKSSITWHYRLSDPDYGKLQANECKSEMTLVLDSYPVEILEGKKNLEVRPHHINKGEIVSILLAQRGECDFILCCGDDQTDEDMFKTLNSGNHTGVVTVHVGPGRVVGSVAAFGVDSPLELIRVLNKLG